MLSNHVPPKNATRPQGASKIGLHHLIPLPFRNVQGGCPLGTTSAVDQDLDATEFGTRGPLESFQSRTIHDIAGLRQ